MTARAASHDTTLANGRNLYINKFELTPVGLRVDGKPSFAEWDAVGCFLQVTERAIQWWIGDWLRYGEDTFQQRAAQAINATGLEPETIAQYEWVARQVPIERREPSLSFSHHREVADLSPESQTIWLKRAADGDNGARWPTDKLRREITATKTGEPIVYWLMVKCAGKDDLDLMTERLRAEGRTVKARDAENVR